MGTYRDYTPLEEKLNSGSHFIALLTYLVLCPILIFNAVNYSIGINIAGLVIYSVGLVAVFFTSTMYHYIKDKELKKKFRTMDHMAIFLLIGGTYTPLVNKYIENPLGTIFLTILWTLLISGIFMKFFFMGKFKLLSIILYVFLGGMVVFIIQPIMKNMPTDVFRFTVAGGLIYLFGILFYINKKKAYTHTAWHIFVMTASFLHFLAIWRTCFE